MLNLKKIISITMIGAIALSITACSGSDNKNNDKEKATTPEVQGASWWTKEQQNTINSLKQCDEEGYLYEIDFTADFDVEQFIAMGNSDQNQIGDNFQKMYLPDSEYKVPRPMYGGCAAFATKDADGNQIMGRNYDWDKGDQACVVFHLSPKNGYKSVNMGDFGFASLKKGFSTDEEKEALLYAPILAEDGINEKGLACTVLILDEDGTRQKTDKTDMVSNLVIRLILDKASTVKEAEKLLDKVDLISTMGVDKSVDPNGGKDFHWLVTDKTGDSAVFEFVNNEFVVSRTPVEVGFDFDKVDSLKNTKELNEKANISYPKKDTGYQLVTNFYVSESATNTVGEGYWRYQTLHNMLKENPNPTKGEAMEYLKAVKFYKNDVDTKVFLRSENKDLDDDNNWAWITVWSEVYDTKNLTMDVCIRENFDKTYQFSIK